MNAEQAAIERVLFLSFLSSFLLMRLLRAAAVWAAKKAQTREDEGRKREGRAFYKRSREHTINCSCSASAYPPACTLSPLSSAPPAASLVPRSCASARPLSRSLSFEPCPLPTTTRTIRVAAA